MCQSEIESKVGRRLDHQNHRPHQIVTIPLEAVEIGPHIGGADNPLLAKHPSLVGVLVDIVLNYLLKKNGRRLKSIIEIKFEGYQVFSDAGAVLGVPGLPGVLWQLAAKPSSLNLSVTLLCIPLYSYSYSLKSAQVTCNVNQ